jgi:hypothetical protein
MTRRTDISSILIIGAGQIVIGQAVTRILRNALIACSLAALLSACDHKVRMRTPSPDGTYEAMLWNYGGSTYPFTHSVRITGPGQPEQGCIAASFEGNRPEDYVRLVWTGPKSLEVRYGLSSEDEGRDGVPTPHESSQRCTEFAVRLIEDPAASEAATRANADVFPHAPATMDEVQNVASPTASNDAEATR